MPKDPTFKKPVLTALEKFVWENGNHLPFLSAETMAAQLNRTTDAIHRAYARAERKVIELDAIRRRGQ